MLTEGDSPNSYIIRKLVKPTDEQKSQMLHVFLEGFKTDRFVAHLCEGDEHREALSHLSRLESAYIDGEVWVIEIGGTIVSVAIWSAPGQTLWDTVEKTSHRDRFLNSLSEERRGWLNEACDPVIRQMVPAVEMKNRVAPGIGAATYYLHTIVTLPSERGRGLGKALLRQMEFIAKAKGKQMGLGAMSHSDVHLVYRKAGFNILGEVPIAYPDGSTHPYVVMLHDCA